MDTVMLEYGTAPTFPPSFPIEDLAMVLAAARKEVSVHVFRTPTLASGRHEFLYERLRCRPDQVFATGATVIVKTDDGDRVFELGPDLGPFQVEISADVVCEDRDDLIDMVVRLLDDLKADTVRKEIPKLVLRVDMEPEVLVHPHSLVVHEEGLFRIGHGWLFRWDETTDVTGPQSAGNAADLHVYAADGRFVGIRLDLL